METGQVSEQIEGGPAGGTVSEISEKSNLEQLQEKTKTEAAVKHELDASSEANHQVSEVSNTERDGASADAIDPQKVTDDA